ncbi:hypothetical protein DENSPDRAFT_831497 [Dentipellis sp. KUC8613]|nr:hypothetical protein DENSPDRAFT_831497 [Dentipellis sp. KUC8613]
MLCRLYRSNHLISTNTRLLYRRYSSAWQSLEKPFYVTTPIFYPNAVPHIGHLYTIVTADIIARHARLTRPDRPVYFMTGTDEHGLKIQKAAKEKGLEPSVFCDQLSEHFRALAKKADTSHTRFIRTSEQAHYEAVQDVWRKLDAKGLIYKGSHKGWYSISDECFYTDTQIKRIETPAGPSIVSIETGSAVEWMEEENYKFRLSAFRDTLLERYQTDTRAVYPPHQHSVVLDMLSSPLEDLSISRPRSRLYWGIPVPNDPDHTMYVWFDALTVYLTATGYPWGKNSVKDTMSAWPPNLQIIGKDIVRFHAIYFPAMLLALDLPLPERLLAHSHWTVNRLKMSKSIGNVADPIQAIDIYGVDLVRYYLARVGGHFKNDVDWSTEQLDKFTFELQSLLGNFYLRINSAAIRKRLPEGAPASSCSILESCRDLPELRDIVADLVRLSLDVDAHLSELRVADALDEIIKQLQAANQMLTATEPWSKNTPSEKVEQIRALSLELLRICGILLQPFTPSKATQLLDALGVPADKRGWTHAGFCGGPIGSVKPSVKLFQPRPPTSEGGKP